MTRKLLTSIAALTLAAGFMATPAGATPAPGPLKVAAQPSELVQDVRWHRWRHHHRHHHWRWWWWGHRHHHHHGWRHHHRHHWW